MFQFSDRNHLQWRVPANVKITRTHTRSHTILWLGVRFSSVFFFTSFTPFLLPVTQSQSQSQSQPQSHISGVDACHGDSGGPASIVQRGRHTQVQHDFTDQNELFFGNFPFDTSSILVCFSSLKGVLKISMWIYLPSSDWRREFWAWLRKPKIPRGVHKGHLVHELDQEYNFWIQRVGQQLPKFIDNLKRNTLGPHGGIFNAV